MCDCCDPTSDLPDPVVVRLEAEVERWKLNVADAQGRIRELHDNNTILRGLLREAVDAPVCEEWFERVTAALEGKP